jgi:choline/glycine/proline betaine transport protein
MFIAKISRGRTFGEFIGGVLLTPTIITIIWIGLFGGTALYEELFGGGGIIDPVNQNVASAIFVMFEQMDIGFVSTIISYLMVVLIATYLITSANAGTLVVTTILSSGSISPPSIHRAIWGAILALLTGFLLVAGGLDVLQSAVITAALPFSFIIILMVFGLIKSLSNERTVTRSGSESVRVQEPWAVEDETGDEANIIDQLNEEPKESKK